MSTSKKRKTEEGHSDLETGSQKKKARKNSTGFSPKKVKRKERTHSISSSNDEDFNISDIQKKSFYKDHNHINYNNEVKKNSDAIGSQSSDESSNFGQSVHLINFKNGEKRSRKSPVKNEESSLRNVSIHSNNEMDNECSPRNRYQSDQNNKKVLETNGTLIDEDIHSTQFSRSHSAEDEGSATKFSFLMDDNLIEKNIFWSLQCPANIETTNLLNQHLDLDDTCLLEDGSNKYEVYSYKNNKNKFTTLAVPCGRNNLKPCRIPINGNIIIEEIVNIGGNDVTDVAETPQFVKFPNNLRTRHPLLGIDYEDQPKTIFKKSKKKHSKNHSMSECGDTQESTFSTDYMKRKKHKKNKKGVGGVEQPVEESYEVKRKKKKHKIPKEYD